MEFYKFDHKFNDAVAYLDNQNIDWQRSISIFLGEEKILSPLPLTHIKGKRWLDILTVKGAIYFVSEKFIKILETENLTGWEKFPLLIKNEFGTEIEGYYGFSVLGRCSNNLTQILSERCIKNWDGSDFFVMRDTLLTFMTEKAYTCLKNRTTNSLFTSFDEFIQYLEKNKGMFNL